jgi:hypothetical protein
VAQSLTDIMGNIRGGFALHKAGEKLNELVLAVKETGKKGSITLTIEVAPDKNDENVVSVAPSVKTKIPEKGFTPGVFFATDTGELTREDPRQQEMFKDREAKGVAQLQAGQDRLAAVGRGPQS